MRTEKGPTSNMVVTVNLSGMEGMDVQLDRNEREVR